MGEIRQLVLDAIALKDNPPASHLRLRSILNDHYRGDVAFKEYQVIQQEESARLVNFYIEQSAVAIDISDGSAEEQYGDIRYLRVKENNIKDSAYLSHIQSIISESIFGGRSKIQTPTRVSSDDNLMSLVQSITLDHIHEQSTSESISDIIGNPPGWLLRSGITILSLVTISILILSHMISYPDKINASGYMTTEDPPIALIAPHNSIIDEIYTSNGHNVNVGDEIIYFKNTALRTDVDQYKSWIENAKQGNFSKLSNQFNLGGLQSTYSQLLLILEEYDEVKGRRSAYSQISTIKEELNNIVALNNTIDIEETHFSAEEELALIEVNRAKLMYEEGLISKVELERAERNFAQFSRQVQSTTKSKVQNEIRLDQLNLEAKKIVEQRSTELRNYRFQLNKLITQIEEEIDGWYQQHIVYAETQGTIEIAEYIEPKYAISAGDQIAYVIPSTGDNEKILKSKLPVSGAGKVVIGTKCIIKLHNYPYKEFGVLTATISEISRLPTISDNGAAYEIIIDLPDQIITDYDHMIPYKPNMTALIEVITEDKSILSRITEQLTDLIQ